MEDLDYETAKDYLLKIGVSEETIDIVGNINGFSVGTLDDILFTVEGVHFETIREDGVL